MAASLSFPDRGLRPIPVPSVLLALRRRYSTNARALCKLIFSALSTNRSNSALSLLVIVPRLLLSSRLVILACVTGSSFKRLSSGFSKEINSLKSIPRTCRLALQSEHQTSGAAERPPNGTSSSDSQTRPSLAAVCGAPERSCCAPPTACRDLTTAILEYHPQDISYHLDGNTQARRAFWELSPKSSVICVAELPKCVCGDRGGCPITCGFSPM